MRDPADTPLTSFATTGGCAAKIAPTDLFRILAPLASGEDSRVVLGAAAGDDAGVFAHRGVGLVATTDFIPPVCDDPRRYGRVAAANALSDVYAVGGEPLFALNLCCFPPAIDAELLSAILAGAAEQVTACGAAVLGGHSVRDPELKFGLAVVGEVALDAIWSVDRLRAGDALILTKPLGTGVYVNARRAGRIDEAALDPVLIEMERLNRDAAAIGRRHGTHAATDVTGFGIAGHAWNLARSSGLQLEIHWENLPLHEGFLELAADGVTTGCTAPNAQHVGDHISGLDRLTGPQREVLFDPQTSGGLLLGLPAPAAAACVDELRRDGHRAAVIGRALEGPAGIRLI